MKQIQAWIRSASRFLFADLRRKGGREEPLSDLRCFGVSHHAAAAHGVGSLRGAAARRRAGALSRQRWAFSLGGQGRGLDLMDLAAGRGAGHADAGAAGVRWLEHQPRGFLGPREMAAEAVPRGSRPSSPWRSTTFGACGLGESRRSSFSVAGS